MDRDRQHPRWNRPYTELAYQPMLEVMQYLRDNGYKTYIVTGGGQDFVRVYSERVYGIPPEQVVGSTGDIKYGYDKNGKPMLTKEPKLLLNDNDAGKPEGIHLMIGHRPHIAFGNSPGDRQMLEYTKARRRRPAGAAGTARRRVREYAYGPAQGLPDTRVGAFTQALYDEAKRRLDGDQHEERLEADLRIRVEGARRANAAGETAADDARVECRLGVEPTPHRYHPRDLRCSGHWACASYPSRETAVRKTAKRQRLLRALCDRGDRRRWLGACNPAWAGGGDLGRRVSIVRGDRQLDRRHALLGRFDDDTRRLGIEAGAALENDGGPGGGQWCTIVSRLSTNLPGLQQADVPVMFFSLDVRSMTCG